MALNRLRIPWDWEKLVAQGQTRWRKSHWGLRCLQWSMQIRWPCRCTEALESHSTMLPRCHTDPGTTISQHVAISERGLGRSYQTRSCIRRNLGPVEFWDSSNTKLPGFLWGSSGCNMLFETQRRKQNWRKHSPYHYGVQSLSQIMC